MQTPIVILIGGAPGTGKSTVQAHAPYVFREEFGQTAALSVDRFYQMFDPLWQTNNREWWQQALEMCVVVTNVLLRADVRVLVIEGNGLAEPDTVRLLAEQLAPMCAVYHFVLDAQLDVVVTRVRQRGDIDAHPPKWLVGWLEHVRATVTPATCVVDMSALTTAQVLDSIVQHVRAGTGRVA